MGTVGCVGLRKCQHFSLVRSKDCDDDHIDALFLSRMLENE